MPAPTTPTPAIEAGISDEQAIALSREIGSQIPNGPTFGYWMRPSEDHIKAVKLLVASFLSTEAASSGVRDGWRVKALAKLGWNACRKSIYAVCEAVMDENEKHRADTENAPRHHFGRGGMSAAKSIARGFNALEAEDDNNFRSIFSAPIPPSASPEPSGTSQGGDWQPIDGAPKDERGILAGRFGKEGVGSWRVVWFDPEANPDFPWHVEDAGEGFNHHRDFFTHWMPLPAPPVTGASS